MSPKSLPTSAAAIRARLTAATPGPWVWDNYDDPHATGSYLLADEGPVIEAFADYTLSAGNKADMAFIANAPADLAWALARIAQLELTGRIQAATVNGMEAQLAELLPFAYDGACNYHAASTPNEGPVMVDRIEGGEFGPRPQDDVVVEKS